MMKASARTDIWLSLAVPMRIQAAVLREFGAPLELEAVTQELDRRGIELVVEPEQEAPPPPAVTAPVETTTDALQLFLREAGKHALLTAAQVVALVRLCRRLRVPLTAAAG